MIGDFSKRRRENFKELVEFFKHYNDFFYLPNQENGVETSWLAFPLTIKKSAFSRMEIVRHLEENGIRTRPLFTGNILRQPGFRNIPKKTNGEYPNANAIMENSFVIGCHQGIEKEHMEHIKNTFGKFLT